tara:strand:- start:16926 stop:17354 length:429 start_codon:yes stop_codon:yes gene_type:complete
MADLEAVLKEHGLRKTTFRKELLSFFYDSNSSLTAEEVKIKVGESADKVTIYRGLDAFEKSGLIHRVPDKSNLIRYAICHSQCSPVKHIHNHAHFICNQCNETFCIDEIEIPPIAVTKGFLIKSSKLILEGECPDCIALIKI